MLSMIMMGFGLILMCFYDFIWGMFLGFMGLIFIVSMIMGYSEMIFTWGISHGLGIDLLSWSLVSLSIWVSILMLLASYSIFKNKVKEGVFISLVIFLMIFLICTFLVTDLLYFYIMFESSLIPTFLLILGWGYQPERLQAGVYLLFYTLTASLPLLFSLFMLDKTFGSLNFLLLNSILLGGGSDMVWYFISVIAFFVSMPMFFVHLWLPKAHVEAPVAGSMILAGVLLKLGGYGLFRLMKIFVKVGLKVNFLFISIGVVGGAMVSLMCFRQFDLKMLIAYSSVAHMGLVLGGILSMNLWGYQGGLVMMLGHGLCSSGLFCAANIFYERVGSRSMIISKGLMSFFPSLTMLWFLLCVCNMAAPPSLNLLGEISLFISLLGWSAVLLLGLMGLSFFSAVYSLIMFCSTQHGKCVIGYSFLSVSSREYLVLFLHWFPLNFLIMKCDLGFWWI